jgi:energy-coupling factor transporter ATP-binding protein EcfA2
MRIREIVFKDFRCFRGERRISFVDPVTDIVRPMTVLAGSNGSGKTTVLDSIEAVLAHYLGGPKSDRALNLLAEARETGLIHLVLEVFPADVPISLQSGNLFARGKSRTDPGIVTFSIGRKDLVQQYEDGGGFSDGSRTHLPIVRVLPKAVSMMDQGEADLHGGLLYFPHDRRLAVTGGGPIEPLPSKRQWLFHFSSRDKWQGGLEHLWVWQNYLDLEEDSQERHNLAPFVESVETVLGKDRRITISKGRVHVPVQWDRDGKRPRVRLDQLPSGEQQVLLLFGELARRRRKGAVIMIDEVENSLHPTLQRLVMWNLRRVAREWDAQVIVATHSLEVINSVRGGAFINLDYPEDRFDLPVPDQEPDKGGRE